MTDTQAQTPVEFEVTITRTVTTSKTYTVYAVDVAAAKEIALTRATDDRWREHEAAYQVQDATRSTLPASHLRFNVGSNIFNRKPEHLTPGDMNLRIWFADHANSPFGSHQGSSQEIFALRRLLNAHFNGTGQNYVLTHGSEAELSPNAEHTLEALGAAAKLLQPLVIEILVQLGCFYDPNLKHPYARN